MTRDTIKSTSLQDYKTICVNQASKRSTISCSLLSCTLSTGRNFGMILDVSPACTDKPSSLHLRIVSIRSQNNPLLQGRSRVNLAG